MSALQTLFACERKYHFRYVQRIPDDTEEGAGLKRGKEGHARIEHYLKKGQDVLLPLERLGITEGYIPAPGPDLLVEHGFSGLFEAAGVPMTGFIDLVSQREGILTVTDWKFRSDLAWSAKRHELTDVETDAGVQMMGYAEWARKAYKGLEKVRLQHVNFQTRGPARILEVSVETPLTMVESAWQSVSRRAQVIHDVAAATSVQDIPFPEGHDSDDRRISPCLKYGKCPYFSKCKGLVAQFKIITTIAKGRKEMGIMDRMKRATAAETEPIPVKSLIIDESTTPDLPRVSVLQVVQGRRYLAEGRKATFLCHTVAAGKPVASFIPEDKGAPILLGMTASVLELPPSTEAPLVAPPDAPKSDPALASRQDDVPLEPLAPPPVVTTRRGPGRPKRDPSTPPPVKFTEVYPAVAEKTVALPEPIQAKSETVPQKADGPDYAGVRLYIGCSPLGVATESLGTYVDELERLLLEKFKRSDDIDLRAAGGEILGFGKWKGYIAKLAVAAPPEAGSYSVMPGDERIDTVVRALESALPAGNVTVGR